MKSVLAFAVLFGLATAAVAAVLLRGDKIMSMRQIDTGVGKERPPLDSRSSGRLETATFSLG